MSDPCRKRCCLEIVFCLLLGFGLALAALPLVGCKSGGKPAARACNCPKTCQCCPGCQSQGGGDCSCGGAARCHCCQSCPGSPTHE